MYFLVLFGLYREQDELSVDGLRQDGTVSISALRARIESPLRESYPMTALKWNLLVVSVVYLGSGFDKLVESGIGWAAPDNLSRILLVWTTLNTHPIPLGEAVLEFPVVVGIAAASTLILEVGLIVAVLAGVTIVPFALGIIGMQAVVGIALGPFFRRVRLFRDVRRLGQALRPGRAMATKRYRRDRYRVSRIDPRIDDRRARIAPESVVPVEITVRSVRSSVRAAIDQSLDERLVLIDDRRHREVP